MVGPAIPARPRVRTCVGCRVRATKSDLLRVTADEVDGVLAVVPDPRGRRPGRGASLHPVLECLDLAERRRAFPRALRLPGPFDTSAVREEIEQRSGRTGNTGPTSSTDRSRTA